MVLSCTFVSRPGPPGPPVPLLCSYLALGADDAVLESEVLSKQQKRDVKSALPEVVTIGVGDTPQQPGRLCRQRLQLDRLSMYAGPEATLLEAAVHGRTPNQLAPTLA